VREKRERRAKRRLMLASSILFTFRMEGRLTGLGAATEAAAEPDDAAPEPPGPPPRRRSSKGGGPPRPRSPIATREQGTIDGEERERLGRVLLLLFFFAF